MIWEIMRFEWRFDFATCWYLLTFFLKCLYCYLIVDSLTETKYFMGVMISFIKIEYERENSKTWYVRIKNSYWFPDA